jgi:hypothetical protein
MPFIASGLSYADLNKGARKIAISPVDGTVYALIFHVPGSYAQFTVYRSTDNGDTWASIGIPSGVPTDRDQNNGTICCDSTGALHLVWTGKYPDDSLAQIRYSKYTGTWSAVETPSMIAGHSQDAPCITVDSNNIPHIAWHGVDSSSTSYYQIKYTNKVGGTWAAWTAVSSIANYGQYNAHMAIDSNNKVHIVWDGRDSTYSTTNQIKYSTNASGSWSVWTNISPAGGYPQASPRIATDSNNKLHVVWWGRDAGSTSVYQIKYTTNTSGSWAAWTNLPGLTGFEQIRPDMFIKDNVIHVFWLGGNSGDTENRVKYSKYESGTWSAWVNRTPLADGANPVSAFGYGRNLYAVYIDKATLQPAIYRDTVTVPIIVTPTSVTPTHVYNGQNSTVVVGAQYADPNDIAYRVLINGAEYSTWTGYSADRTYTKVIPFANLVNGNNTIRVEAQSAIGDSGYAEVTVIKEVPQRLTVDRTFLSYDGGYIAENVALNGTAKVRSQFNATITSSTPLGSGRVHAAKVSKWAKKVEVT